MYQSPIPHAVPNAPRVLVLEDRMNRNCSVVELLNSASFRASASATSKALIHAFAVREPDLVIIDLDLQDEDGLELLRELRKSSIVPIILITAAHCSEVDRVVGLELGADDYLSRPVGSHEVLARSRAVVRRRTMNRASPSRRKELRYAFAGWTLDQRNHDLSSPSGRSIALTKNEYALLSAMVEAPRRALSREHLLRATRVHEDVYDRSIDVQILRLRRKLKDDHTTSPLIRTQRGVGYIFDADVTII